MQFLQIALINFLKGGYIAMANKIEFDYEDEHYILEFSRRTVSNMEQNGFVLQQAIERPATMIPQLFAGAFAMHHPRIKEEKINAIYKALGDKDELFPTLIECYRAPLEAMFDEPEDESKKVKWKKN